MDVRIFKMSSGVELIAELSGTTNRGFMIKRPLQIHMMHGQDGPTMGFAPWCMVAEDKSVHLYEAMLACDPLTPISEVAASYVENVTGLALPPSATTAGRILME